MNLNESNIVGVDDLEPITTPALSDVVPVEQDGNLGKLTLQQIANATYPIGSIYQQLPPVTIGETTYTPLSPNDLFTGTTWVDISTGYAGAFFRAGGGNSAEFGTKQDEGLPNITSDLYARNTSGVGNTIFADNKAIYKKQNGSLIDSSDPNAYNSLGVSDTSYTTTRDLFALDASRSSAIYGANEHVTPENYAIKIWIRTA